MAIANKENMIANGEIPVETCAATSRFIYGAVRHEF